MSAPSEAFDPYDQWLGIPPSERPCDHYRLLGLPRFEEDLSRVVAAAEARMTLVRSYQVGPRGRYTQRVLNELSAAKVCLTTPAAKSAYDESLRLRDRPVAAAAMISVPIPPPVAPPLPPVHSPPLASRLPKLAIDARESDELESDSPLADPVPWWRPMFGLVGAALLVLAVVTVWAISTGIHRPPRPTTSPITGPADSPADSPGDLPPEPGPPEPLAIVQQQEASGQIHLALTTAELSGGLELVEADAGPQLQSWQAEDARAAWEIALVEPGFFQVELVYATTAGMADSTLLVTVGEQAKHCSLRDSGGLDTFLTDAYTIALPRSGRHTLVLESSMLPAGGDLVVRSVRLIPVGGSAPAAR